MTTIQYKRVKELAKKNHLSLNEVEEKIGMKKNALYAWNRNTPSSQALSKVADFFNVPMDYLIGKEKPKEHLNIEPILNASQLYFKNTSLSEHDTEIVKNLLKSFLESEEGQQRLRDRGYSDKEKEDK